MVIMRFSIIILAVLLTASPAAQALSAGAKNGEIPADIRQIAGTWCRVHFIPIDAKVAAQILPAGEQALRKVEATLGIVPNSSIDIYLAHSNEDFDRFTQVETHPWVAGVAFSGSRKIVIKLGTALKLGQADLRGTLIHEITHILIGQEDRFRRVPLWLNEGLAQMLEDRPPDADAWYLMAGMALAGFYYDLDELAYSFPSAGISARRAYAQSLDMTRFLRKKTGLTGIRRILGVLFSGGKIDGALESVMGTNLVGFQKKWRGEYRHYIVIFYGLTSAGVVWFWMAVIFLVGYVKKRRRSKERLKQMEIEESFREPFDASGHGTGDYYSSSGKWEDDP